ncbi:MAG: ATP--guanido phosphotransferase [Elusimicrobiota bacterium]
MKLSHLATSDVSWLHDKTLDHNCVISTRIRLARNLKGCPFPSSAAPEQLREYIDKVFTACKKSSFLKNADIMILDELSEIDRRMLLERHIISCEHAFSSSNAGVIIDNGEKLSIMVNEEDVLRIQYISGGLNLFEAWDVINSVDNELSEYLDFAYSDRWGYLTACPTNTGTGMRASCQMHLAGLGMINGLKRTMENVGRMGMVVRGLYGEGTKIMGNMLQVSNQVTLGISEARITDNLNRLVVQVAEREEKTRSDILEKNNDMLRDTVLRSHGILLNAYKISFEEALDLISNVRLGVYAGIIVLDIASLNDLMIKMQPAHIQEIKNIDMTALERDKARAQMIKDIIGK